jgi:hypothetical protein
MAAQPCSSATTKWLAAGASVVPVTMPSNPPGASTVGATAAVALDVRWGSGLELGQQRTGVAGTQPGYGGSSGRGVASGPGRRLVRPHLGVLPLDPLHLARRPGCVPSPSRLRWPQQGKRYQGFAAQSKSTERLFGRGRQSANPRITGSREACQGSVEDREGRVAAPCLGGRLDGIL